MASGDVAQSPLQEETSSPVDRNAYLQQLMNAPGLELGRHYSKAPIIEAIVEFHVVNSEDLILDKLADLKPDERLTTSGPIFNVNTQYEVTDGQMTSRTVENQVGVGYRSADGSREIQVALDRFAFVWREQYRDWDSFLSEAESFWLQYKNLTGTRAIRRASARFVNRLSLPPRSVEIKDYVRTAVDVSAYLPQAVSGLFMQVDIPIPQLGVETTITSALVVDEDQEPARPAIMLDIDVKTQLNLDTQDPDFDAQLRHSLDTLRLAKNYVFEACITDATRERIK